MAQKRIFRRKRPKRGRLAAGLLGLTTLALAAAGGLLALRSGPEVPGCADADVKTQLLALLRDEGTFDAEPGRLHVDERKRTFREGELFARECAAMLEGSADDIRYRITRDQDEGYVLTLSGA